MVYLRLMCIGSYKNFRPLEWEKMTGNTCKIFNEGLHGGLIMRVNRGTHNRDKIFSKRE